MFVTIGLLPLLTLLLYALYLGESTILSKLKNQQVQEVQTVVKLIDSHIESLRNEVKFIASLDVMDDMLVGDIDKKISRLLMQKAQDLHGSITALAIDMQGDIVASSNVTDLQKSFDISSMKHHSLGVYENGGKLFIYCEVSASFNKNKSLGYLLFIYDLHDLKRYLVSLPQRHSYLIDRNTYRSINTTDIKPLGSLDSKSTSIIDEQHLIVYFPLSAPLKHYSIVYVVDKTVALDVEYNFFRFMLFLAVVIVLAIIYAALKYSKDVVRPIQNLIYATQKITSTQNYKTQVSTHTNDELALLGDAFNKMIATTAEALANLEKENKLRLERFIQLIEVFNTIIQTRDEQECIEVAIDQIKKLSETDVLYYSHQKKLSLKEEYIELYVTDFEAYKKIYFGSIELGIANYSDANEKRFYDSIGQMITLQLEKIRLHERTVAASRAKSSFISSMSHELRTPLNSIIGFAQYMITCESLEDEQQDVMANIESSAQYLLGMINDILDIAKIEAGKMEVKVQEVEIEPLLQTIHAMLLPLTEDKEITLTLHANELRQHTLFSDAKLIQQVVVNLLSNAIKFTPKGSIDIYASTDEKHLIIKVVDSGIGISQEGLSHLFEDFAQLDNQLQQGQKGSGLGLSISKKIAQLLQGDVAITSDGEGKGVCATFYCALRVKPTPRTV